MSNKYEYKYEKKEEPKPSPVQEEIAVLNWYNFRYLNERDNVYGAYYYDDKKRILDDIIDGIQLNFTKYETSFRNLLILGENNGILPDEFNKELYKCERIKKANRFDFFNAFKKMKENK
jgi:hypothetical protein